MRDLMRAIVEFNKAKWKNVASFANKNEVDTIILYLEKITPLKNGDKTYAIGFATEKEFEELEKNKDYVVFNFEVMCYKTLGRI